MPPRRTSPTLLVLLVLTALVAGAGAAHADGTLRVGAPSDPSSLDPALAYDRASWQILATTGGGLVAFRREGGRAGAEMVPMLAREIPRPTAGGRRLVFHLRPGVRFGPPSGRLVRPSDVKASIERLFRLGSPGRGLYRGITGASAFERTRRGGIAGIVADDGARTVEFRLTRADGGILAALALPFAYVVPAEWDDLGLDRPPASIGPYYVRGYRRGSFVDLARSGLYSPTAALPAGRLDGVLVRIGLDAGESITRIEDGALDATQSAVTPRATAGRGVLTRASLEPTTHALVLDTRRAPFDSLRARQAASLALDRRRIAGLLGRGARPQAGIIPAVLPGGSTALPGRADVRRARALLPAAARRPVAVWASVQEPGPTVARAVARDLRRAGIPARTRIVPGAELIRRLGDPSGGVQIAYVRARHDLPDPGAYLRLAVGDPGGPLDYTRLRDPAVTRLVRRAINAWGLPERALAWARVSGAVRARGAYVPFASAIRYEPVGRRVRDYAAHPVFGFLWARARVAGGD